MIPRRNDEDDRQSMWVVVSVTAEIQINLNPTGVSVCVSVCASVCVLALDS